MALLETLRQRLHQRGRARPGDAPAPSESPAPSLRRSVGIYLLLLSLPLLVLLPLLAYNGSLLYVLGEQARESTERELRAANSALSASVQRELDRSIETLSLVAATPAMDANGIDTDRMRHLMAEVVRANLGILSLALLDRDGRVLVEVPDLGAPQGRLVTLGSDKHQVFETGRPQVSNLRRSELDGRLAVSISYPVGREDTVMWVLTARLEPQHLAHIMSEQVGNRDAVATVMDPLHRIMARTREMERFFGQLPSPETMAALAQAEQHVSRLRTLDGNDYLWAWSTTPAGWSVLLGIPARSVDLAMRESISRLLAMGLFFLLLGVGTTMFLARRIAKAVDLMAGNAPRLLRGQHPPYRPSRIRQLDALYEALVQASDQVRSALADRDRALAAERAARQLAVEDNRTKDVFIATLSHELRNPLAPVRSAAHILKAPNASDAARSRATSVIERQVTAMARLLDDLLDLSRIRSGRIELNPRPVSLRAVLESAVETARPLIEARRHEFHCSLPGEDVMLQADPLRLSQVFSNLLTNAAKYTDEGGRIDVWAEVNHDQVLVHVLDSGIGLEPDQLEQVFQMFSQVRSPLDRTQGGLGIGLWLVRGLVELHHGWVRAESSGLGRGSEFVVGLPLPGQAPQPARGTVSQPAAAPSPVPPPSQDSPVTAEAADSAKQPR